MVAIDVPPLLGNSDLLINASAPGIFNSSAVSPGFEIGKDILNLSSYATKSELKQVTGDLQGSILVVAIAVVLVFIILGFFIKRIDDGRKRLKNEIQQMKRPPAPPEMPQLNFPETAMIAPLTGLVTKTFETKEKSKRVK